MPQNIQNFKSIFCILIFYIFSRVYRKTLNACYLQRSVRIQMHLLHLACLISHGFLRNKWINDIETQNILRNKFKDECPLLFMQIEEYKQGFSSQQLGSDDLGKILLSILQWFKRKFEIIALGIGRGSCHFKEYGFSLENCVFSEYIFFIITYDLIRHIYLKLLIQSLNFVKLRCF